MIIVFSQKLWAKRQQPYLYIYKNGYVTVVEKAFGTILRVTIPQSKINPITAHKKINEILKQVQKVFDRNKIYSEINLIDQGITTYPSDLLQHILHLSYIVCRKSNGAFNPLYQNVFIKKGIEGCNCLKDITTCGPIKMDFDGIAKGFTAGLIANFLRKKGIFSFLIDFGGDLVVGKRSPPWRIGIRKPGSDDVCMVLKVQNKAVCTSGSYERGPHIISPDSKRGIIRKYSVTVIGPDPAIADALATATFVLGQNNNLIYNNFPAYEFIFCNESGRYKIIRPAW